MSPESSSDTIERPESVSQAVDPPAADASITNEPSSCLWLTNRDQWLVVVVAVVVVVLLGLKWTQLKHVDRSAIVLQRASEDIGYQIDLNSATWVELTQLRGIGVTYARRIVEDREESGPFSSIDDLQRVRGIGPITVEKNRRWLRVGTPVPSPR
ncbi:MAG: helix-hairpin-helix domain-containing protein [Planctomycetota bacterium]|nr:helix-hairpin-helix domain-containing protein [Planctomycetota bacterium]